MDGPPQLGRGRDDIAERTEEPAEWMADPHPARAAEAADRAFRRAPSEEDFWRDTRPDGCLPAPEAGWPLTASQKDILAVLEAEGRRLTTLEVLGALGRAGRLHGESTVKQSLSHLVK